jgi:protein TonB
MFEQSLLDLASRNGKRRWTVLAGTALQCSIVGLMVLLPLIYTEAVPKMYDHVTIGPPPGEAPRQSQPAQRPRTPPATQMVDGHVRVPTSIPDSIYIPDQPEVAFSDPGGSIGPGVIGSPGAEPGVRSLVPTVVEPPTAPKPKPQAPREPIRVHISVQEAMAISRPQPVYPDLARKARIQGVVRMEAVISKIGTIENLKVLEGSPLLWPAARDAVLRWRYRPTILNGEPVEVITTIEVHFTLSQ